MLANDRNVPEASHKILDAISKHCFDKPLPSRQVLH
jgi:hypothetical protein